MGCNTVLVVEGAWRLRAGADIWKIGELDTITDIYKSNFLHVGAAVYSWGTFNISQLMLHATVHCPS